jgi:hypothetical protein
MRGASFKTEEDYEKYINDSTIALNEWAAKYIVPGCMIARDTDGNIKQISFSSKHAITQKLIDEEREESLKAELPKAEQGEEEKGGCKSCGAKGLKRLILGGAKLLKAELGIDAADKDVIESRKQTCLGCDRYNFGVCEECGCFCAAKVKLASEKCPIGKW